MGWYREEVLPRLVDRACGTGELRAWRRQVAEGLWGTVLEIGFGSGLNVPVYPAGVERVLAVEPSLVARRLAEPRVASSSVRVEHVGLHGEALALPDACCDGALSTFTLCTIPGVEQALAEVFRVLKPAGRFHFLEHGRSPDGSVARWQERLDPLQQRLADGCHLTRTPLALVQQAGFEVSWSSSRYARGPRPWTWMTSGVAVKPVHA